MRFAPRLLRYAAFPLLAALGAAHADDAAYRAVVQAERDFAAMAPKQGVTAAFRHWMAPDSIMFLPAPTNGGEYYKTAPPAKSMIDWGPSHAEVSASGDLGYTFGPATYTRLTDPAAPKTGGWFFSIWQRQPDGSFRNVLDQGIRHQPNPVPAEVVRRGPAAAPAATRLSPEVGAIRLQALVSADRALAAQLAGPGAVAALRAALAPDAVLMREGSAPLLDASQLPDFAPHPRAELSAVRVAAAGDLGATAGWGGEQQQTYRYQRAWRWDDGQWKLVVDLSSL